MTKNKFVIRFLKATEEERQWQRGETDLNLPDILK